MDKTSLQMLFGVLLGVFLLALIVITVVYVRRKLADKREEALRDLDLMQEEAIREEQSQSKGYWINRDDIEDENQAHLLRYYHYFDNIDECIHDRSYRPRKCVDVRRLLACLSFGHGSEKLRYILSTSFVSNTSVIYSASILIK